jgi:hypothetical protein
MFLIAPFLDIFFYYFQYGLVYLYLIAYYSNSIHEIDLAKIIYNLNYSFDRNS